MSVDTTGDTQCPITRNRLEVKLW